MMADYNLNGPHVWHTKATLLQAVSQTSGTGETRWKSHLSVPRLSRMPRASRRWRTFSASC